MPVNFPSTRELNRNSENEILENIRESNRAIESLDRRSSVQATMASGDVTRIIAGIGDPFDDSGTDPFTGTAMLFPPYIDANDDEWHIIGMNGGVLQFGLSATDGKAYAGGGAVVLDIDGITISGGNGDANRIKFVETDGSELVIYETISSAFFILEAGSTNPEAALNFSATSGVKTVALVLVAPETDKNYVEIRNGEFRFNELKDDFDFRFSGDTQTNLLFGDASLDAIGIGGVPASGSVLDVNSVLADKDTNIYGTSSTPISTYDAGNNSFNLRRHFVLEQSGTTISSDAITVTTPSITVDTEAAAAADNLATINGGVQAGQIILLRSANSGRDVTVKDGTGNINLSGGDRLLSNIKDRLFLQWDGIDWCEVSFGDNV